MTGWRIWGLIIGGIVALLGALFWSNGGGSMMVIFGLVILITAALEPVYGRPGGRPIGGPWQPTDERFVDPESGKLVTVWFNPGSGERRYVEEKGTPPAA